MSQTVIIDHETVTLSSAATVAAEPLQLQERTLYALVRHEHLTLVNWGPRVPTIAATNFAPVRPVRRPWFGWSEVCVVILLLASGVAFISLLGH